MAKIVLIGGASGVAKSSTAKIISEKLNITHRLGSGFIREMAKCFISSESCPALYRYSFYQDDGLSAMDNLVAQSRPLQPMIELALMRANREGTGLVIEGVNVIPGITEFSVHDVDRYLLCVQDEEVHYSMVNSETHANRYVSMSQFKLVRSIQSELLLRATMYGWKILDITKEDIIDDIQGSLL